MVREKFQCTHWKFWASGNAPPRVPQVQIVRRRFGYTSRTSPSIGNPSTTLKKRSGTEPSNANLAKIDFRLKEIRNPKSHMAQAFCWINKIFFSSGTDSIHSYNQTLLYLSGLTAYKIQIHSRGMPFCWKTKTVNMGEVSLYANRSKKTCLP